jgi:hypothetical protein
MGLWREMEMMERKKMEYGLDLGRSVGWNVVTWRAGDVLVRN